MNYKIIENENKEKNLINVVENKKIKKKLV